MEQLAPGLSYWIAYHPEWKEDVVSYALETAEGLVLVDPLLPRRELGSPDHVVLTVYWHARSARDLRAKRVWAPHRSVRPLERRGLVVTDPLRPGDTGPGGTQALASGRVSELVYWLPEQRALVAGDVLLGAPLRICPDGWVGRGGQAAVRAALQPALELPIERVLVSHGGVALAGDRKALAKALRQAASAV